MSKIDREHCEICWGKGYVTLFEKVLPAWEAKSVDVDCPYCEEKITTKE